MHRAVVARVALRVPSVRFAVPQCSAAPQQFERIVEARLGLRDSFSVCSAESDRVLRKSNGRTIVLAACRADDDCGVVAQSPGSSIAAV